MLMMRKSILLKYPYDQKQSTDSRNLYQNSNGIFHRSRTNNSKICIETNYPKIVQIIMRKNKSWKYHSLDFRLYYKVIVIKTVWYWH